ncbi:S9 family peptidase [Pseudochryseolinea flava]|uniref:S9 family peptidase n=2 Tax=Pseudochryseolinea flava TaxID=2059302 RepID=A0A364Y9B7_9BACT|nr:S9 family peptidase [Pseudochryseolinea flava]
MLFSVTIGFAQDKKESSSLVLENVPDVPSSLVDRMTQYQNTRWAALSSWIPNGKGILMLTRFAETAQLHQVDFPGGDRKQITFFKEPVGGGTFCPDTTYRGFMFTRDAGGNEFSQLYWFDLKNGKYTLLSDGGRSQNSLPTWSNKGNKFTVVSTKRNGKDYDIYVADMKNPKEAKIILQQGGSWSVMDWSPDDKKILVQNYISANKSFVHVLDVETGALEQINSSNESIAYAGGYWSADGKGAFIISDANAEFQTLQYYDFASKKLTPITSSIHWDVSGMTINKKRTTIAFTINENGVSKIYTLNTSTKDIHELKGIPSGVIGGLKFHPNGKELGFVLNTPATPSDIFSIKLDNIALSRWTASEVGGLDNSTFVSPEQISFESFDNVNGKPRTIPAFYYKPKNVKGKIPVIIYIHGGPEAQALPTFSSFNAYLTNELGVAIIAPNVRGSSGYGKNYLLLDNGYKREDSVKDIGALLDWIAKQPELDASRVAVWGGSYGGYMVLASMTHYNARLKCAIDVVGISNFVTFLQNTEDYRKDLRRVEYGDERDPKMKEFLLQISPANHVDKITKPLFIIQGLNDPRVPASESEQMKLKMQSKGQKVWYMLAKDEGHGFRKKANVDHMQWAIVMFLQEHLLK